MTKIVAPAQPGWFALAYYEASGGEPHSYDKQSIIAWLIGNADGSVCPVTAMGVQHNGTPALGPDGQVSVAGDGIYGSVGEWMGTMAACLEIEARELEAKPQRSPRPAQTS
jgi:hypothetical protein